MARINQKKPASGTVPQAAFFVVASFVLFLLFQATHIVAGDSGDLVTAAATFGVAHPPGYPLYTLLGWVVTKIFFWMSPAWSVGLLSSIPAALSVGLVFFIVARLTKRLVPAALAALTLVGNYVFFLYSVTPEVFALFDLFIVVLFFVLLLWQERHDWRLLVVFAGVLGLSLSHHHVMVFALPAFFVFAWQERRVWQKQLSIKRWVGVISAFLVGLLPYLSIPIAAHGTSMINWDRPTTLSRFIHLLTRADYGTFVSGGAFGSFPIERLVSVVAYGRFLLLDLTIVGIVLAVVGLLTLWRTNRSLFWFCVTYLITIGPFFVFYASFPIINKFGLGTYERFLLPSYMLLVILVGVGIDALFAWAASMSKRFLSSSSRSLLLGGLIVLFTAFAGTQLYITLWRFWGLRTDATAEALGRDVLASVDKNGIVLLGRDTTLFTTQYVRYALGVRPDVAVLHIHRMAFTDYAETIHQTFPELAIPEPKANQDRLQAFVLANLSHPFYTNAPFAVSDSWMWIPHGLLYVLVKTDALPPVEVFQSTHQTLWSMYHDPLAGILSRYNHLMLSDVRDVYAEAHLDVGKVLLNGKQYEAAAKEFAYALKVGQEQGIEEAYTYQGKTFRAQGKCPEALTSFNHAQDAHGDPTLALLTEKKITYDECVHDAAASARVQKEIDALRAQTEMPLAPQ